MIEGPEMSIRALIFLNNRVDATGEPDEEDNKRNDQSMGASRL